jgi:hypothetical protein
LLAAGALRRRWRRGAGGEQQDEGHGKPGQGSCPRAPRRGLGPSTPFPGRRSACHRQSVYSSAHEKPDRAGWVPPFPRFRHGRDCPTAVRFNPGGWSEIRTNPSFPKGSTGQDTACRFLNSSPPALCRGSTICCFPTG